MVKRPDFNNVYHMEHLNGEIGVFETARKDAGDVLADMLAGIVDSAVADTDKEWSDVSDRQVCNILQKARGQAC